MQRKMTIRTVLAALAVLTLAGTIPHAAFAEGDKGKDKGKKGPVIIGPITTTTDPTPPKKK